MRVLVTGAAGFIGSHFTRYWLREHPADEVIALDALTYRGNVANLPEDVPFVHADIASADVSGVDVVVNFAAESHNSLAVLEPERFFRTNVLGTQALLESCRRAGVRRFHHVSTCEVYGDLALDATEAFHEESPYRPRTPYNASKAGADHAVRSYHETFDLPVTISNCANNYGPNQFPETVLPLFTTRALTGQQLPIYASSSHRREWIHVLDHCRAIDAVLHDGDVGRTYHVGTGVEATVDQIADLVLDELGLPSSRKSVVADRPGHDRRYLLDSTRIERELGWRPEIGFDAGVRDTIRWYAANRAWWEPLLDRGTIDETAWATTAR
ncbi:dTDP-glucose 4,6-dehydratase [Lentzea sp. NPDC058450]|uniref:dTDP-glucose 4,6-dehydratase n=1 Tax=Lentzea sp. NPDC058450 TaxID=3346505 RepID=UPI0036692662